MTHRTPRRSIGALMGKARLAFNRDVTELVRARGHENLRPSAAQVFRGLDQDGTTISTLAKRADVTRQTMWALVRALEEDRYVSVKPHREDGRAKLVRLTASGRRLTKDIIDAARKVEARLARRLGSGRVEHLRRELEAVLEAFGETYRTDWYPRGRS